MRRRWRCFHCDEVFTRERDAAEHFGADQLAEPACQIKGYENLLVRKIREQEKLILSYLHEDATVLRAMKAMQSDHAEALRRAEEAGYNRGVVDTLTLPESERAREESREATANAGGVDQEVAPLRSANQQQEPEPTPSESVAHEQSCPAHPEFPHKCLCFYIRDHSTVIRTDAAR